MASQQKDQKDSGGKRSDDKRQSGQGAGGQKGGQSKTQTGRGDKDR